MEMLHGWAVSVQGQYHYLDIIFRISVFKNAPKHAIILIINLTTELEQHDKQPLF